MSSGTGRANYVEEFQFPVVFNTIDEDINLFNRVDLNNRLRQIFRGYPDAINLVTFFVQTKGFANAFNQNTTMFIPTKDFAGLDMRQRLDRADTTLFYNNPSAVAGEVDSSKHVSISIDRMPELKFIGIRNVWNDAGTADPVNRYRPQTFNATTGGDNYLKLDDDISRDWMAFMFCPDLYSVAPNWSAYAPAFIPNNFLNKYKSQLVNGCSIKIELITPFSHLLTGATQGGPGLPQILNDLTDVNHTAPPANGQVLTYNTGTSQWEAVTPVVNAGKVAPLQTGTGDLYIAGPTPFATPPAVGVVSFYNAGNADVSQPVVLCTQIAISRTTLNGINGATGVIFMIVGDRMIFRANHSLAAPSQGFSYAVITSRTVFPTYILFGVTITYFSGNFFSPNTTYFIDKDVPSVLDQLVNVVVPSPANGDVLTYNTGTLRWINQAPTIPLTLRYGTKYDFEGLGPKVVLTPVLNTWYSIPIDVFFQTIGLGASISGGNIVVSAVAGSGTLSVSVGMYANVQDTRCEWSLFLAGGYELNSKTPLYSKNSTSESETISTNVWNVDYGPGTTISIRVRFTEDNSPNPVVTQISITKLQITLNQV